jgi:hypothetical protein
MISSKNESVFIRDLSNLTLQIILDPWWASMNVCSKRPIAWKNAIYEPSWRFYLHCGIEETGSPGIICIVCHQVLRHPSEHGTRSLGKHLLLVLATGQNSRAGSGDGSTRNRTVATGLTTWKTRPIGNGPVFHQKPSISSSQVWLQLSIWVLIVSWHEQYVDCAVLAGLSPPDVRFAIRLVFVESLSKTRQLRAKYRLISQRFNECWSYRKSDSGRWQSS